MSIKKDITVTVQGQKSIMSDDNIYIYQGDKDIDLYFTIIDNRFEFEATTVKKYNFTIRKPDGDLLPETSIVAMADNKAKLTITEDMANELSETGQYDILIHLYDEKNARITIPEISFEVKKPLMTTNVLTNSGIVSSAILDDINEKLTRLTPNGKYNRTVWQKGDLITKEKLNKIEYELEDLNNSQIDVTSQLADITKVGINVCSGIFPDLQTAFNFCADNGIPALMPSGTFSVGNIIIKNKLHIKGIGKEKTILKFIGTGDFLKYDGSSYTNEEKIFFIEDLTLIGTNKIGKAISLNDCTGRQLIKNVSIRGFETGIYAPLNCWYGTLDNVKIEHCDIGLYMIGNCYFWNVVDSQINNNRINLYAKALLNNTFNNTDFSNSSECSIKLDGGVKGVSFTHCWFEKNKEFIRHTNVYNSYGISFEKCYFSTQAFVPTSPNIFNFEHGSNINIIDCFFDNDISDTNEIVNIQAVNVGLLTLKNPIFRNNNKPNLVVYPNNYQKERVSIATYSKEIGATEENAPVLSRQYNENIMPNSRMYNNAEGWSKAYSTISQISDANFGNVTQIVATSGAFLFNTIDKTIVNKLNQTNKSTYAIVRIRYKSLSANAPGGTIRIRFSNSSTNDDKVYTIINDDNWHDITIVKHTSLVNADCTLTFSGLNGTYQISDLGLSINGNVPINLSKSITEDGGNIYNDVIFTINKGCIVKTPDGTKKYRIGVDNSGNITSTLVP